MSRYHDFQDVVISGSQLYIPSLERRHQWSHHTCFIQNSNMTAPKSVAVTIQIDLPPLDLQFQNNISQPLIAGQNSVILCLCSGSYPKAHINWMKDNEEMDAEDRISYNGTVTTSFIEFRVQPSDNGKEIECSAYNPHLRTEVLRKKFVMNVYFPPKDAIIRGSSNKTLEGIIGPYHLGETVQLKCESSGGNPTPTSLWKSSNSDLTDVIINGSQLTIRSLGRHHQWSHHTCSTQNYNMISPKSVAVTIQLLLPPLYLQFQNNISQPLIAGQNSVILCLCSGSYPKAHIYWMKDNEEMDAEDRISDNGTVTISFIEFRVQPSDNGKEIECSAFNPQLKTVVLRRKFVMNVHFPPKDAIIRDSSNNILEGIIGPYRLGETVQLICESSGGNPTPTSLWKSSNSDLSDVIINGSQLTIPSLRRHHQWSRHTCSTQNFNMTAPKSVTVTIELLYMPKINIVILSNKSQISEGQNFVLLCNISANPEAKRILWYFDNREIVNDASVVIFHNKLYIKNLTQIHSGTFRCQAENEYGMDHMEVLIDVKHKPVCRETEISYSYGQEIDDVNVTCNLASYPSDVIFYWTLHNTSSNHSWSTGQVPHTRIELQKSNLELICWGRNEIGDQISPCRILLIKDKPQINIVILSNQSQISEGQNFELLCNSTANPKFENISWYFDNKEIVNDTSVVTLHNKLNIKNLTQVYSGTFGCQTENEYGIHHSEILIAVKHTPVCQQTEVSYSYGQEIDDVNLTCNLVSYPSDVTFYWTLRNTSSNYSWSTGQVPHTRIELQKSNSELLCWGRNEIGDQISPCRILLIKAAEENLLFLPAIIMSVIVLTIFFIAFFIVCKKIRTVIRKGQIFEFPGCYT